MSADTDNDVRPAAGTSVADVLPADGSHHFRGDIEGLRAVAVLLVVADHLFAWPAGGFIGVDVFFVISGFLITGLLLREHQRTGRISFADFYRRRVRRILPASLLVLAVTAVASFSLYFATRAEEILGDVGWSVLFAANWRFAVLGTDYLHADGPVSPVQHYWSLAVEEQFYVVWPVVLVVLLAVAGARGWSSRRRSGVVLTATLAITAGSFGYALHNTAADPQWAYFSTATRAWELGVGAIVAIVAVRLRLLADGTRTALAVLGLGGVLVSPFVVTEESGFPAPWGLLPVLASAVLIASGTGGRAGGTGILTNPVARYLGALSYSLYLWHFPVIILGQALYPEADALYYAGTLLVTAVAAAASYHLVEQPIRRSRWLRPAGGGGPGAGAGAGAPVKGRHRQHRRSADWPWVAVAAAVLVAGVALAAAPWSGLPGTDDDAPAAAAPVALAPTAPPAGPGGVVGPPPPDPRRELSARIDLALDATDWPALDPGLDALGIDALAREWVPGNCLDVTEANVDDCTFGTGTAGRTLVILGDSMAISWLPGIRAALPDWTVVTMTYHACPAAQVSVVHDDSGAGFTDACDDHHEWAMAEVARLRPAVVVLSSVGNSIERLASGAEGPGALQEWTGGLAGTVEELSASAGRVVVLADPPGREQTLAECATRLSSPSDCDSSVPDAYLRRVVAESAAVAALGRPVPAVEYVRTEPWFCAADGRCPAFVGTTTVYADKLHITRQFSGLLAPILRGVLAPAP
ncbi:acyltransferase family protein [Trujillonella endophytica]|uniref:Peptidoglycan/LPS O-acetylase OafA/YrhL, contains acyltransferase and SGNH-hydrolase domains n=1 Tax=Trujillonella endophytica TaxID=673521 RepID=A0A1H8W5P5_9ACTN|nr:acyltransferase family protein [Trujillella endophytica]SEP22853.1 Peptidoglycan/LPS O-acetylase OafA/YrhL, contains acyltransferase and SGNH-hydrolase domains [Trujillella endophytica]